MSGKNKLTVDQHEIKFTMAFTLSLIALSWIFYSPIPAAIAGVCQLISSTGSRFSPYSLIYRLVLLKLNFTKPHIIPDDPVPHRFASLIGGIITLTGSIFLWANYLIAGWIILLTVFTLQNLNFWVNFCMMYYMYYLLHWLKVPGFRE